MKGKGVRSIWSGMEGCVGWRREDVRGAVDLDWEGGMRRGAQRGWAGCGRCGAGHEGCT